MTISRKFARLSASQKELIEGLIDELLGARPTPRYDTAEDHGYKTPEQIAHELLTRAPRTRRTNAAATQQRQPPRERDFTDEEAVLAPVKMRKHLRELHEAGRKEAEYWKTVENGGTLKKPRVRCKCGRTHPIAKSHQVALELLIKHTSLDVPDNPEQTQLLFRALFRHGLVEVSAVKKGLRFTIRSGVVLASTRVSHNKPQKKLEERMQRLLRENNLLD